jgi:hypothetical protein
MTNRATPVSPRLSSTRTRTALAASLLGLLLGAPALAAPGPLTRPEPSSRLTGPVSWTAVSGRTGADVDVIGGRNDFQALYAIRWYEDSDEPCKFQASVRHVNTSDLQSRAVEFCGGSPGSDKYVSRPAPGEYITGIQVCLTDKPNTAKDKLKGIRLWGRTLDHRRATLGPENGPAERVRSHCEEWSQRVSCPIGQVATKFKIFHSRDGAHTYDAPHGFARGISLGCREVERN